MRDASQVASRAAPNGLPTANPQLSGTASRRRTTRQAHGTVCRDKGHIMSKPQSVRMTADRFLAWAMDQPEGQRYELASGEVIAMAPARAAHARAKRDVLQALGDAIAAGSLPCEALPDGMAVRIDDVTVYEPDAAVRCGPPLPGDAIEYSDSQIVIEVLSPATRARDSGVESGGGAHCRRSRESPFAGGFRTMPVPRSGP